MLDTPSIGLWVLFAVCPQSTLDHACIGGRELNMPMGQYSRLEFCEFDREDYAKKYPHISFQCTRDFIPEL